MVNFDSILSLSGSHVAFNRSLDDDIDEDMYTNEKNRAVPRSERKKKKRTLGCGSVCQFLVPFWDLSRKNACNNYFLMEMSIIHFDFFLFADFPL